MTVRITYHVIVDEFGINCYWKFVMLDNIKCLLTHGVDVERLADHCYVVLLPCACISLEA